MFLPEQYAWFEPVLIATIVVFIIDLVGNWIGFGNRFLGAPNERNRVRPRVRNPCLFRLRQRVDVSDDNAESNCPCSNAKVGRPNRGASDRCSGVATDAPRTGGAGLAPGRPPRIGRFRYAPIATKFRSAAR